MSVNNLQNSNLQILPMPELKKILIIPLSVIIASSIIIMFTTNMSDKNSLNALLSGYIGLLLGLSFTMMLISIYMKIPYLQMIPIIIVISIVFTMIIYLSVYFNIILSGNLSSYYSNFSILSLIFLGIQISFIFKNIYSKIVKPESKLFPNNVLSLSILFGVINFLFILMIGIILNFYSTQG